MSSTAAFRGRHSIALTIALNHSSSLTRLAPWEVRSTYNPWAKANKKSWKIDMSRLKLILAFVGKKRLPETTPLIPWWPLEDSNLQPKDYESSALPLS